jgi:uncharacterized membrane protein
MQTFIPILLNVVYPGSGYLYLKDDYRKTIAKFLVIIWSLFLLTLIYNLVRAFMTGEFYLFVSNNDFPSSDPLGIPMLAIAMWSFMVYDTYKLARSKNQKGR